MVVHSSVCGVRLELVTAVCMSRSVWLICCRIILTASNPVSLLIRHPSPSLSSLPSGRVRSGVSCYTWTLMVALTYSVCFLIFFRELLMLCPHLSVVFRRFVRLGSFPACWRQPNVTPIPKGPPSSSVAIELPTDFHNISIVEGV